MEERERKKRGGRERGRRAIPLLLIVLKLYKEVLLHLSSNSRWRGELTAERETCCEFVSFSDNLDLTGCGIDLLVLSVATRAHVDVIPLCRLSESGVEGTSEV